MKFTHRKFNKKIYKADHMVTVALTLVTIMLCITIGLVFTLPKSDAHGLVPWDPNHEYIAMQIDVNLKDSFLFAWHRDHLIITAGIVSLAPTNVILMDIPDVANGVDLNITAIILISVDAVTLAFASIYSVVAIKHFHIWKNSRILVVMLWFNTVLLAVILVGALLLKNASVLNAVMNVGVDGRKLNSDSAKYLEWAKDKNPGDLSPFNMESITVSYTTAGGVLVSLITGIVCASTVMFGFGIHQRHFKK